MQALQLLSRYLLPQYRIQNSPRSFVPAVRKRDDLVKFFAGLTVLDFTTWLESQPPEFEYWYDEPRSCPIALYFRSLGFPNAIVGGSTVYLPGDLECFFPPTFDKIVMARPRTFGAAAERARQVANG